AEAFHLARLIDEPDDGRVGELRPQVRVAAADADDLEQRIVELGIGDRQAADARVEALRECRLACVARLRRAQSQVLEELEVDADLPALDPADPRVVRRAIREARVDTL